MPGKGGAASADGSGTGETDAGLAEDADTDGAGSGGSAGASNVDANRAGAPNDAAPSDAPASSDAGAGDGTTATDTLLRDTALGDADATFVDIDPSQDGAVGNDVGVDGNVDASTADADAAPAAPPIVGVLYNIVAEHSGGCMTAIGNLPVNGTNIAQWGCDGSSSQQFRLQGVTTSSYIFVHPATNRCVDVDNSGTTDGTNVAIWTCNNSAAQIYALSPAATPGYFAITNPNSGKCLDVNGAGNIQIYACTGATNQSWRFVDVSVDR
jgi:hypothetical protein